MMLLLEMSRSRSKSESFMPLSEKCEIYAVSVTVICCNIAHHVPQWVCDTDGPSLTGFLLTIAQG